MKEIGGYTFEQSADMITFASAAAEAAGVAPRDVMADIANSSKVASEYFGDNPRALAKAAIEARRLGLALEDMSGIADKLLDIEQSIENQFTAQVLTGKNINFDTARRLALEGDIEGATKSVLAQLGSIDDFNQMDVIQKRAVADAAGLTVEQLTKSLKKQEDINNLTTKERLEYDRLLASMEDGSKSDAKKLLDQTKSLALQEEFNATIENLKEQIIMPLTKKLMEWQPMIKGWIKDFKEFVGGADGLLNIVKGIAIAWGVIKAAQIFILGKQAAMFMWSKRQLVVDAARAIAATTTNSMATFGIGTLIAVGAVAAALGALAAYGFTTGDDVTSPAGYGDRVLSTKKGSIALNNADDVVAGTNLGGGSEIGGKKHKELIAKMNELITVVKTAKPLNIDGAKVGEAIYIGSIQGGAA